RDPLALEEAERVCPRRADAHALLARDPRHVGAQLPELVLDLSRRAADGRRDLEHGLHQLRVDAPLILAAVSGFEDGLDVLDEVERLAVEQHVLLLDAERVRVALAEGMVEHAAAGREARALARDRRWVDLLRHQVCSTASASISTRQRGSSSAEPTTIVL